MYRDASVIVVAGCGDAAAAQVAALEAQRTCLSFETIVVDSEGGGAAHARNTGTSRAGAPLLLFCVAENIVGPQWVDSMVAALAEPRTIAVPTPIIESSGVPAWARRAYDEPIEVRGHALLRGIGYPVGETLGLAATTYAALGGFDETIESPWDVTDLTQRALIDGMRLVRSADARFRLSPPPGTWRRFLQQRAERRGAEQLLRARDGGPIVDVPLIARAKAATRGAAGAVLRDGQRRPSPVAAVAYDRWLWSDARRAVLPEPAADAGPQAETFMVPLDVAVIGGLGFRCRPGLAGWYASDGVEHQTLALVQRLLRPGATFVDCGANIGIISVAAALTVGRHGHVVAFEPDPRTRALLEKNLERHRVHDLVDARGEGVADREGELVFHQYANDPYSGFCPAPEHANAGNLVERMPVPVTTLDRAVPGAVDLLKIDVEGFEVEVLSGAQQLLARSPDAIVIFELNPPALRAGGHDPATLLELFPDDEWSVHLLDDYAEVGVPSADLRSPADLSSMAAATEHWFGNVIAARRSRLAEVEAVLAGTR